MSEDHPFEDLTVLQVKDTSAAPPASRPKWKKREDGYVTLSARWADAIDRARTGAAFPVARRLIELYRRNKQQRTVTLSDHVLEVRGVDRWRRRDGLKALVAGGLIAVEFRGAGQAPRVTWLVDPFG
jgi:hypothetical protein